jgi:SAM-dependent methyltransferase
METNDVRKIIDVYYQRFKRYGVSPRTLGWDKNRAKLRFEILCSQWDLNDSSILDFGCGFGDFYKFLNEKNYKNFTYYGIDINPCFIETARTLHPEVSFQACNILENTIQKKFDYIFASGAFNDKISNNVSFIKNILEKMDEYSAKGIGANFLSNKAEYRYQHAFYADPAFILDLCYQYSNNVVLRNDYMPFEFTVFINKISQYHPEQAVYEEFMKYL